MKDLMHSPKNAGHVIFTAGGVEFITYLQMKNISSRIVEPFTKSI